MKKLISDLIKEASIATGNYYSTESNPIFDDFKRVYVGMDYDGNWYCIPYDLKEDFLTSRGYADLLESQFENKFSKYMIGGDLNNVELYAKI